MSQFNVYDIFGYLLPGALVVAVFFFALSGVWPLPALLSLEGSLALIVLAYIAGHFLRASIGERWIKSPKPSEKLLSNDCKAFIPEIRDQLRSALLSTFSPNQSDFPEESQQQYFDLAYALIVAKNCAGNVPIYNSLYALYRGLIATSWLSSVLLFFFAALAVFLSCIASRPFRRGLVSIQRCVFVSSSIPRWLAKKMRLPGTKEDTTGQTVR